MRPPACTVADIAGLPRYFGPFANYANSPMPKGSIASIVLDNAGEGYSAPTVEIVDVYGTATTLATASITATGGLITDISLLTPGAGYTAPLVSISDPTGSGAAATATLVLGSEPFNPLDLTVNPNGGIRKFINTLAGLYPTGVE